MLMRRKLSYSGDEDNSGVDVDQIKPGDDDDDGSGVDQTSDNWREASDNSGKLVRPGTWEKMLILIMMMINDLMFIWMWMLMLVL